MKILIDINLSRRWVSFLASHGIEAIHWSVIGQSSDLDSKIALYAEINDYTVLTHDLDFGEILAFTNQKKPSVIQIRSVDVVLFTLNLPFFMQANKVYHQAAALSASRW
jgi:predicted nuclease of predicted toxin-antitoxin system